MIKMCEHCGTEFGAGGAEYRILTTGEEYDFCDECMMTLTRKLEEPDYTDPDEGHDMVELDAETLRLAARYYEETPLGEIYREK